MLVSLVIVNYNGVDILRDCLGALEAQTRRPDEVILVDNASTDASVPVIRDDFPWVTLIEAENNLGFAAGNNLGIRHSSGEAVILLNNDTVAGPSFVERIVEPLERSNGPSAVAGVMLFAHHPEIVATAGIDVFENGLALDARVGSPWRELPAEFPVFGPSGGAAAYRRSALDDVGLFPEPFFLYLEDADLAWRLRLRGHRTVSVRDAWALHIYSASSGEGSRFKDFYLARNRVWTLLRCWPPALWREHWRKFFIYELSAITYGLWHRRPGIIHGRAAGWMSICRLRRVRRVIQQSVTCDWSELLYWLRPAPSAREMIAARQHIANLIRRIERDGTDN